MYPEFCHAELVSASALVTEKQSINLLHQHHALSFYIIRGDQRIEIDP